MTERALLDSIAEGYKSRGYSVELEAAPDPSTPSLRVDLIARKGAEVRLVEVRTAREAPSSRERLTTISELRRAHPEWQYDLVPIGSGRHGPVTFLEEEEIARRCRQAEQIMVESPDLALLAAWSAFESVARRAAASMDPAAPVIASLELLQVLAYHGLVTPTEADSLRAMSRRRNEVAHGGVGGASVDDVRGLLAITRAMRIDAPWAESA